MWQVPTGFEQANNWARVAHGDELSDAELVHFDQVDDDAAAHPPIAVLAHNRADALRKLLSALSEADGLNLKRVTVYQDGSNHRVARAVADFFPSSLVRLPKGGEGAGPVLSSRLTFNYRFMLEHAFDRCADHVIVLEEDLLVSRDFLVLFTAAVGLMRADPTIFCTSGGFFVCVCPRRRCVFFNARGECACAGYNDNGFDSNVADGTRLWRGEHFMALGWMLSSDALELVEPQWQV